MYYQTCLHAVIRNGKAKVCGKRTAAHTRQGWPLCREHAKGRDDVVWCASRKSLDSFVTDPQTQRQEELWQKKSD